MIYQNELRRSRDDVWPLKRADGKTTWAEARKEKEKKE